MGHAHAVPVSHAPADLWMTSGGCRLQAPPAASCCRPSHTPASARAGPRAPTRPSFALHDVPRPSHTARLPSRIREHDVGNAAHVA